MIMREKCGKYNLKEQGIQIIDTKSRGTQNYDNQYFLHLFIHRTFIEGVTQNTENIKKRI